MKNAKLILNTGTTMYENTKNLIFFAPAGLIALIITALFCGEYALDYLLLTGHYGIVNVLVFFCYMFIIIGSCVVWPYFMGLILIGIGQIAMNTCVNESISANNTPVISKPTISSLQIDDAKRRGNWICSSCGKENRNSISCCEGCGMYK